MKVINPATEEVISSLLVDTKETIVRKYKDLQIGQKQWAKKKVSERISILLKFGDLVKENIDDLSKILMQETGKPILQAYNEIKGASNRLSHLEANAEQWLKREKMVQDGITDEEIVWEPLGVIGNISAWNFPYNVGYNVFLYALAAGNAVLYKPSEYASLTGLKIQELLWEAGVPEDVFECVIGDGTVGQLLLDLPLDGYYFTGSNATGKIIATAVAPKLVPVQLELGGKDPLYVMEDVPDVKIAAINAAEGAFYNNGQSCCAVERIYVHEKIYDAFVDAFVEEVETYKIGDPSDVNTFIGPVTRKQQIGLILSQVEDALLRGAQVQTGGNKLGGKGNFMLPTVVTDVNHSMALMKEESFGPIVGIQKVRNDQEALSLMQDTEYGLTAAIFSKNKQRADKLFKELNTGTVYWNCCDRVSPQVPWSGRKGSGLGMTLSYMGIRAFTQPKAYHLRS